MGGEQAAFALHTGCNAPKFNFCQRAAAGSPGLQNCASGRCSLAQRSREGSLSLSSRCAHPSFRRCGWSCGQVDTAPASDAQRKQCKTLQRVGNSRRSSVRTRPGSFLSCCACCGGGRGLFGGGGGVGQRCAGGGASRSLSRALISRHPHAHTPTPTRALNDYLACHPHADDVHAHTHTHTHAHNQLNRQRGGRSLSLIPPPAHTRTTHTRTPPHTHTQPSSN